MDLQEVGCGGMDWVELALVRVRWRALSNVSMKLRVPKKGNFLTSRKSLNICLHMFTSWNSDTSHKACIRIFKTLLSLLFTPLTATHCDLYTLTVSQIIDLFICLEACCHVTSMNVNCHWYWKIIGRNQCQNLIST